MVVKFRTDELLQAYRTAKVARRLWNEKIARLYVQRVDFLMAAPNAMELSLGQSFGFKAMAKGTPLAGKFSIRLDGFYRLIVSFEDAARTVVVIEEVSKHYDD